MAKFEKSKRHIRRVTIGVIGLLVVLIGIIAIPYPGPGWLIVFAGLAILATEFDWAQNILDSLKNKYDSWQEWIKRQSLTIKTIFFVITVIIVIITVWLLNGYGFINEAIDLNQNWLKSPLSFFR